MAVQLPPCSLLLGPLPLREANHHIVRTLKDAHGKELTPQANSMAVNLEVDPPAQSSLQITVQPMATS